MEINLFGLNSAQVFKLTSFVEKIKTGYLGSADEFRSGLPCNWRDGQSHHPILITIPKVEGVCCPPGSVEFSVTLVVQERYRFESSDRYVDLTTPRSIISAIFDCVDLFPEGGNGHGEIQD